MHGVLTNSLNIHPQVYQRSVLVGRDAFLGYALCRLPSAPGRHECSCPVWAPVQARRSFSQALQGERS